MEIPEKQDICIDIHDVAEFWMDVHRYVEDVLYAKPRVFFFIFTIKSSFSTNTLLYPYALPIS